MKEGGREERREREREIEKDGGKKERRVVEPGCKDISCRAMTPNHCYAMANQYHNDDYQSDLTDSSKHFQLHNDFAN